MSTEIQNRVRLYLTGCSTYVFERLKYVSGKPYDVDPDSAKHLLSQVDEFSGLPYFETGDHMEQRMEVESRRRPKPNLDNEEIDEAPSNAPAQEEPPEPDGEDAQIEDSIEV